MSSETKNSKNKGKKKKAQKIKLPKTPRPGKIGFNQKLKSFAARQRSKVADFSVRTKNQISNLYSSKLVHQEIYLRGKEPKAYSFKKRFFGLYVIFVVYSLILITAINIPGSWINFLTFGNPFAFSNAIIAFFLILSFLFSIDKIRIFIFEGKTALKQLLVYSGIIAVLYLLFLFVSTGINFITYLLALSMIWLVLLSSRFYIYSRKFATKIEAKFIKKYSRTRYFFAIIIPFLILAVLVIISLFYRSFLVFLSLDFFAVSDPSSAVAVYILEMRRIMPLIYVSLVLTLVFIIFEFVSTRRRAETRRAGTFDNFTFSLIVLFIFFFQIIQITIYLLLQPETITALKTTLGATGSAAIYVFILEFVMSIYFLYRIVKKTGKTLGWRILIFKQDGLIMLCLACVFAQTLTRFSLASEIPNQILTDIGEFLMADKYIISVLMIFFLGSTILIYYLKPHETSMFMRLQKETIGKEEQSMEKIYKIIRSEYIRRGKSFPIDIIERELIKATKLSKGAVYELLEDLAKKDMDILITEEKQEDLGKPIKIINFTSVTERFEKKGVAKQKAKKFLSERLFETAIKKEKKTSRLLKGADPESEAPTSSFISSLSTDYSKKQKDKELLQQKLQGTEISFTDRTESLKDQIIGIIKKEYIYRIEKPEKNPIFFIPISEISNEIESATRVTPGELYPILEDLNKTDLELRLVKNPDEPEDKLITFLPFSDDNMCYSLANFRLEAYSKFKTKVTKNFLKNFKAKRDRKRNIFQLKKGIPKQTETHESWITIMNILHKDFVKYNDMITKIPDLQGLRKDLDVMINDYEKREALKNSIASK